MSAIISVIDMGRIINSLVEMGLANGATVTGTVVVYGNRCGRCGKNFTGTANKCTCNDAAAIKPLVDGNKCGRCGKNFTGTVNNCTCDNDTLAINSIVDIGLAYAVIAAGPIVTHGNNCGRCGKNFTGTVNNCTCDSD